MTLRRGTWGTTTHPIEAQIEWALAIAFLLTVPELCFGQWPWDRGWPRFELVAMVTSVVTYAFLTWMTLVILIAAAKFPASPATALRRIRGALVGVELKRVREILRAMDTLKWRVDREAYTDAQGRVPARTRKLVTRLERRLLLLALSKAAKLESAATRCLDRTHRVDTLAEKVAGFSRTNFLIVAGLGLASMGFGRHEPGWPIAWPFGVVTFTPALLLFGAGGLLVWRKCLSWHSNGKHPPLSDRQSTAIDATFAVALTVVAVVLSYARLRGPRVILDEQAAFDAARLFITRFGTVVVAIFVLTVGSRRSVHPVLAYKLQAYAVVVAGLTVCSTLGLFVVAGRDWFVAPMAVPGLTGFWMIPTLFVFGGVGCARAFIKRLRPRARGADAGEPEFLDGEGIEGLARNIEHAIDRAALPAKPRGALSVAETRGVEGGLSLSFGRPRLGCPVVRPNSSARGVAPLARSETTSRASWPDT